MWILTEHKEPKQVQDIEVKILLKDMAAYTYATTAGEFENHFNIRIKDIPRKNIFSADLFYKVTQRNLYSVEVWKLTADGEFKHKMYTLNYSNQNQ